LLGVEPCKIIGRGFEGLGHLRNIGRSGEALYPFTSA
jgi:hypothetical protein